MPSVDPRLVTLVLLHVDVDDRRRIIAHDHRGQARFDPETSRELRRALGAVGYDPFGQSVPCMRPAVGNGLLGSGWEAPGHPR